MDFSNNVTTEITEVMLGNSKGAVRSAIKVFNPEASTMDYNLHHVLRKGSNGCYVIAEVPASFMADDEHNTYVLALTKGGQYVTWLYNAADDSFYYGNYFGGILSSAYVDMIARAAGRMQLKQEEEGENDGDN